MHSGMWLMGISDFQTSDKISYKWRATWYPGRQYPIGLQIWTQWSMRLWVYKQKNELDLFRYCRFSTIPVESWSCTRRKQLRLLSSSVLRPAPSPPKSKWISWKLKNQTEIKESFTSIGWLLMVIISWSSCNSPRTNSPCTDWLKSLLCDVSWPKVHTNLSWAYHQID